jgi:hypothetical protein
MTFLTEARPKTHTGLQRLAVMFLASFMLLLGAAWYSTAKLESVPLEAPSSARNLADSGPAADYVSLPPGDTRQAPVAQNGSFAPFLHIVPSQDGKEIYVKASDGGELGGTLFANVGIGPGHDQGSYTMTFSDTNQTYIATAPGFTAGMDDYAPLSITTTLGLDTGSVEFNRDYVEASTPRTITSRDGNMELELVNTDTITFDTYVAVVPSYGLPGPLPSGHRLVGSIYSVRAAGALLETDRPMSLRLYYNDTSLAGAAPHTLAIFAWDAHYKRWNNLGGTLHTTPQQYLSVATTRFTTYALVATTTWRDEFFDLSGVDFSQLDNVTWGGTPGNRTLILASTPGSGGAVSQIITATTPFSNWRRLYFNHSADPPTTTLSVEILSADGSEVLTDVASGTNLADLIDPAQYPSLRLRVNMTSTVEGETPGLERWELSWWAERHKMYLPLVLNKATVQTNDPVDEPQTGITIDVHPVAPTRNDVIRITPSGLWGNACIPVYQTHQIDGDVIRIYAGLPYPPDINCAYVISSWGFTLEVGPLPAGRYTIEVQIVGYSGYWPSYGTETFVISPG